MTAQAAARIHGASAVWNGGFVNHAVTVFPNGSSHKKNGGIVVSYHTVIPKNYRNLPFPIWINIAH